MNKNTVIVLLAGVAILTLLGGIIGLLGAIWIPSWQAAATAVVLFFIGGCAILAAIFIEDEWG